MSKLEKPFIYDKLNLKEIIEEMVEDINNECTEEAFLDMEYTLGNFSGNNVMVVIRKQRGGSRLSITKESFVDYITDN